uniref:Uncharacterized protein n=1 Tax=Anguilla anguilla TaxID=7936 RepID=A0A0E9XD03_ANGAN
MFTEPRTLLQHRLCPWLSV